MVSVGGWRLSLRLRLRSKSRLRLGDGAGLGAGVGAGVGAGMGAVVGAGAEATESSGIPAWAQKSALWAKMALLSIFAYENGPLGAFLEPLSQPGKSAIRSRRPAIQYPLPVEDSH